MRAFLMPSDVDLTPDMLVYIQVFLSRTTCVLLNSPVGCERGSGSYYGAPRLVRVMGYSMWHNE